MSCWPSVSGQNTKSRRCFGSDSGTNLKKFEGDERTAAFHTMDTVWYKRALQTNLLDVRGQRLTSLPPLPQNITEIICSGNQLRCLPVLPPHLVRLVCSNNLLQELPEMPTSLQVLDCSKNFIEYLPDLEHTSLASLICSENLLKDLPILPNTLRCLSCHTNRLAYLRPMPASLILLWAQFNPEMNLILQSVVQTPDPVGALQEYFSEKRACRKSVRDVLCVKEGLKKSNLSTDILDRIAHQFSAILAPMESQIECLKLTSLL